ncbi:MAG: molybdopterin converting factor subunit 1 [Candidatus Thioglobus sp.]|nr:MAG: molybdopterin converting factor subunit 1 [Candidatus Thioglobus sp.]RUM79837.1 MAG: molybdopterin converting factor subunit 1 [Candidatus Thioglobus sp.]RUM81002.1 MAG: molybdopterin converting factor subunit 1 [Candidatus Thioglobus sp.]RUM84874.1 MAG: molybdopterin converting factor subunit 1 [Candidatus Thioglobus sp.]RUM86591.1 MAG: molybdopterin converting factor subunit 1 [Candidatus Thioglobus sp.]
MKILYFASLKESLKIANEDMPASTGMTVKELRSMLIKKYGKQHFPNNILCAVNHEISNDSIQLNNSDEVAFYPPVTGG